MISINLLITAERNIQVPELHCDVRFLHICKVCFVEMQNSKVDS